MLWNPIHRKPLKNRPEERVRLRTIEALLAGGWSRNRMSTEEMIGTFAESDLRTDIICYGRGFKPQVLVECKAEHISLSGQTAEQVARYNQMVEAPYLLMTNGRTDYWYSIKKGEVDKLESPPEGITVPVAPPEYRFEDWEKYGFAGASASDELKEWLELLLPQLWSGLENEAVSFLQFNQDFTDLDLSHYYHLHGLADEKRLALTALNTFGGGSRLVAILSEADQNRAVLIVNLDRLFEGEEANSSLYTPTGETTFDLADRFDLPETGTSEVLVEQVTEVLE